MTPPLFPNETQEYRDARIALLQAEKELRLKQEQVAAQRRTLPKGGLVPEDYQFDEVPFDKGTKSVSMSELFGDKDTLLVYNYMFGASWEKPCPCCTSLLDGFNSTAYSVRECVELVVNAQVGAERLGKFAKGRGWSNLRLVSSANNTFTKDYHGFETPDDESTLRPIMHVFRKENRKVYHHWASELLFHPMSEGHPRHMDLMWPFWNLLDLTPAGRTVDFPRMEI